jgi:hypothetical protein
MGKKEIAGPRKLPVGERRINVHMTIDPVVWDGLKASSKKMGLPVSRVVEILAKAHIAGQSEAFQNVLKGVMKDFIEADRSLTLEEKLEMKGLVDEDD